MDVIIKPVVVSTLVVVQCSPLWRLGVHPLLWWLLIHGMYQKSCVVELSLYKKIPHVLKVFLSCLTIMNPQLSSSSSPYI